MLSRIHPTNQQWDTFVLSHPRSHPLQLSAWGTLKSEFGWKAEVVALGEGKDIQAGALVLYRRLPMKLGAFGYVPFGAYVTDEAQYPALWDEIRKTSKKHRAGFVKWEPGFYHDTAPPDFDSLGFDESRQTIQPPRTIMLDVNATDDDIMARMNQGTRRKIRKSLKNDIVYREATPDDIGRFTDLMQETGERNEFGVHSATYYRRAYELFVPDGHATLLLAEHEGDLLAAVMIFATGSTASYVYGASSSHKRNLMASYGIQWQAIQWAREHGYHYYDMWGVPDHDADTLEAEFKENDFGLWGVYGFKRGWGGTVMRSAGTWDVGYNRLLYAAYKIAMALP